MQVGAKKSQLAELRDQVFRECRFTAVLFNDRNNFVFDELPRRLPDESFFVVQLRIKIDVIHAAVTSHNSLLVTCSLDGVGAAGNKERIMAGYGGVDYIDFDSQLNDEERLVRQTARQFVENEIIPTIEKHSREATFPKHLIPQLGELGFFGANLHGYGCAGMSNVAYGLMTQELERGDSGLRSFVSVQGALVMYPIYSYGSDAQKNKWLPLLQQGKAIGCFGLTEPQFGSNPGGMLTRALKKGNKYILNGEKMWITSGSIADVAVVWAKAEDGKVRGFLVEKG